jgi:hypothetical protein
MGASESEDNPDPLKEFCVLLQQYNLTPDELLAVLGGERIEEVREKSALHDRLRREADKYLGSSVETWPFRSVLWDLTKTSQRFSLDGCNEVEFPKYYPAGFRLGWVNTESFDKLLAKFSHRTDQELWSVGFPHRLAFLIAYMADGRKVSPAIAKPLDDGTIILAGGHHRYAIARALRQMQIPIFVFPEHEERIDQLIRIEWSEPDSNRPIGKAQAISK